MKRPIVIALLVALAGACTTQSAQNSQPGAAMSGEANVLSSAQRAQGWRLLFDGRTLAGWRGYKSPAPPAGWQAADGMLVRTGGGGDLVTAEQFRNFDLELEWMVRDGGNSGIFYRAAPGQDEIYFSAPEMQVLDDAKHRDGQSPLTSAGSVYGLYPAPRGIVKPAGEWNRARVLVDGNHVEHWLNGQRIAAYELNGAEWKQKVAASKFSAWPAYGQATSGFIGLQDHGDWVAYRNIRIRVLP
jgi:hypothetical protein